jgi:hypothetical protein
MRRSRHAVVTAAVAVAVLGAGFGYGHARPATAEQTVFNAPSSIPSTANCSSGQPDATAALQAWLDDEVPNADATARLAPNRCYRTEGRIVLRDRRSFVFDGAGATLRAFTDGTGYVAQHPCDDCTVLSRTRLTITSNISLTVQDLTVDGGHTNPATYDPDFEGQHAFRLDQNVGIVLDHVKAHRVRGDYVYVKDSYYVVVEDSIFGRDANSSQPDGNGRQGLAIVNGENIVFRGNVVDNVARSSIDIEPHPDSIIGNVVIDDNEFGSSGLAWFANVGHDEASVIEDIHITNNQLVGKPLYILSYPPSLSPRNPVGTPPNPFLPDSFNRRGYWILNNHSDTTMGNSSDCDASSNPKLCADGVGQGREAYIAGVDQVLVWGNDGPAQPGRNMALVSFKNVTNSSVVGNRVRDGADVARYVTSGPSCEQDNSVGSPPATEQTPGISLCFPTN